METAFPVWNFNLIPFSAASPGFCGSSARPMALPYDLWEENPGEPGRDLHLTLDVRVQWICESELDATLRTTPRGPRVRRGA